MMSLRPAGEVDAATAVHNRDQKPCGFESRCAETQIRAPKHEAQIRASQRADLDGEIKFS